MPSINQAEAVEAETTSTETVRPKQAETRARATTAVEKNLKETNQAETRARAEEEAAKVEPAAKAMITM